MEQMTIAEKYGPGYWHFTHSKAKDADDLEKISKFIKEYPVLIKYFPCYTCVKHATKYLKNHPQSEYIHYVDEEGRMIGIFLWTWQFHNYVNEQLNKPIITWETALDTYYDIIPCTDCSNGSDSDNSPGSNSDGDDSDDNQSPIPLNSFMPSKEAGPSPSFIPSSEIY